MVSERVLACSPAMDEALGSMSNVENRARKERNKIPCVLELVFR